MACSAIRNTQIEEVYEGGFNLNYLFLFDKLFTNITHT